MRQKRSDYVGEPEKTKGEPAFGLTLKETAGRGGPTRAAPSAAQGGTRNTRRHQRSGRGGWSRAAAGPPPPSSAAGISHCSLPECEYPAEEHRGAANTQGLELNIYADVTVASFAQLQLIYRINFNL